jgi:ligand-binding sensor domain-containing protein
LTGAYRIFPEKLSYTESEGLASNFCFAICEDSNNIIWVGTLDKKGLSKINKDEVINYNCGYIRTITEDSEGNIWAGSEYCGLYKIEPNGNIINYTMLEGLPNNKITDVFAAKDGAIWVATEGGGIAKLIN